MDRPEDRARERIDALLAQAGWEVSDPGEANIHAAKGVIIRNFSLKSGHGFADYLLYVDGKAVGKTTVLCVRRIPYGSPS